MYIKTDESLFKGLVHPKMKIILWFTRPRGILGVYDFILSDESNLSYIKGITGCDIFYKLFELKMCVGIVSVYTITI